MKHLATAMLLGSLLAIPSLSAAEEGAHVQPVKDYIAANVQTWLNDPVIIDAIKKQDAANAALDQAKIDELDKTWRAEVDSDSKPMIDEVLGREISKFLTKKREESGGIITEIFVMDAKGLNVGQSDVTSDYWQGDEDKFQKSFGAGKDAVFVDEAEKDESTQKLQAQASVTISDETGAPIGAVTVGINLDDL